MKKIKNYIYMLMFIFSISLLTGCIKDGLVGPTGEKGEVGPQGETGDKGPKGKDAETETVELFSSDWFPSTFTGSGTSWKMTIPAPEITQAVLDKGIVNTYFYNTAGTPYLYKLPYKGTYASNNKLIAVVRLGEVEIQSTYNVKSEFRYTITPLGN